MRGAGAKGADPEDWYLDLWPAGPGACPRALPEGGAALGAEIGALRALLRGVLADAGLGSVERLIAFGRGADYLARIYRLRQQMDPAAPADRALLDGVLERLRLGASGPEGGGDGD